MVKVRGDDVQSDGSYMVRLPPDDVFGDESQQNGIKV